MWPPNSRFDKEVTGGEDRYYHLVLLAENDQGYANLTKIVSRGYVEGFYYRPRVDMEVLNQFHEGIIALSACLAGEVQRYIVKGLYDEAKKSALKYEKVFGKGNYFSGASGPWTAGSEACKSGSGAHEPGA